MNKMLSPEKSGCRPVTDVQWERARELDFHLWLNSPIYARMPMEAKNRYYADAVSYGKMLAQRHPVGLSRLLSDILAMGVQNVIPFTDQERNSLSDRAYYFPQTRTIHWNDRFSAELLNAASRLAQGCFSSEEIDRAILLHETFHHIEETMEQPTDKMLSLRYNRFFAPVFRELAAFAYVNALWGKGPCQEIDMLWLNVNRKQIKDFE